MHENKERPASIAVETGRAKLSNMQDIKAVPPLILYHKKQIFASIYGSAPKDIYAVKWQDAKF